MTGTVSDPRTASGPPGTAQQIRGTALVVAGLGVLGVANYVFLTVTARVLTPAEYATIASLYLLMSILGPGVFNAVEQETSRLVSTRLAQGHGSRGVVRQNAAVALSLLVVLLVVLAAIGGPLVRSVLGGDRLLYAALLLSVAGFAGVYLMRGLFSGQHRFDRYAVNVGAEGLIRLLACAALPLFAVGDPAAYAFALCAAPAAAVVLTAAWLRPGGPGPTETWPRLAQATGWLLGAQLLSQAISNIGPVLVKAMTTDAHAAGVFAAAFVLARVPLFVFGSAQTILLPTLARATARRDIAGLRRGVRSALAVVAVLGGAGVAGAVLLGDELVRWVFGPGFDLSASTVPLLTTGTVISMVILVLQPGLLALRQHRFVAVAWVAGIAAFLAVFAIPTSPITDAVIAQIVGPSVTAATMAVVLARALRRPPPSPTEE